MTNENVDILYNKFEKKVAKKKRADLKKVLVLSSNEKFEAVNSLNMKQLHPLRQTKGLIGWVATFVGCLFIVFNLLAYSLAAPTYSHYSEVAGKVGTDFKGFSSAANNALTSNVNNRLESGIQSAYIAKVNDIQSYLDERNNSSYSNKTDIQNKTNKFLNIYTECKNAIEVFQESYSVKINAENAFKAAEMKYVAEKIAYEAALVAYENSLIDLAQENGAFDGIPELVYAAEQAKYDEAVESYNNLIKEYTEEQKTKLDEDKEIYAAALEAYEEAKLNYFEAQNKNVEDDETVINAQAALILAQKEYDDAIDVGTYDLSSYEEAIKTAQTALNTAKSEVGEAIANEINEAKTALDNAQKAVTDAEKAITAAVLNALGNIDNAEKSVNDVKSDYQILLDELATANDSGDNAAIFKAKLAIAEIIKVKVAAENKTAVTEKETQLTEAEDEVKPLTDAEDNFNSAEEQLDLSQGTLIEKYNSLISFIDEIVSLIIEDNGFSSSDLFNKIVFNYKTTVDSYIELTESKNDAEVVIDRFLDKNLSVFDDTVSALTEFITYNYSLNILENDVENYSALELSSLNAKIGTALTEFEDKYAIIEDAQAAYEQVYSDYVLAWENYNNAQTAYDADQSEENEVALEKAKIDWEVEQSSYKFLLVNAVNNIAFVKGEANAYLSRLNIYVSLYNDIVENSSSILSDALIYTGEISGNYVDAEAATYIISDGNILLNYLYADRTTLNTVLASYDLGGYADNIQAYSDSANACVNFVKTSDFNQYAECDDLTAGAISNFENTVGEVSTIFFDFTNITAKFDEDGASLFRDAKSYTTSLNIITLIMMVFDIILAVILFCYWLYWVFAHRSDAMEDNYNTIIKKLKN